MRTLEIQKVSNFRTWISPTGVIYAGKLGDVFLTPKTNLESFDFAESWHWENSQELYKYTREFPDALAQCVDIIEKPKEEQKEEEEKKKEEA
ncbi:unnamed protein product, partial [Brenthis ino]